MSAPEPYEITVEAYEAALLASGRYQNPPGWYILTENGPEGPFESAEVAVQRIGGEVVVLT